MLFKALSPSTTLNLEAYVDVEHFRESERYVQAQSIPLATAPLSVLRASLSLPSATLSLVRTFPRIINGYDLSGQLVVVVPMDEVSSVRLNGRAVGHSVILIKGRANCTVLEPETRLVAVLSAHPDALGRPWGELAAGYLLLGLTPDSLSQVQTLIRTMLTFVAGQSEAVKITQLRTLQETLFSALDDAFCRGTVEGPEPNAVTRYKQIVDHMDHEVLKHLTSSRTCEELASELSISVRTLQNAAQSVCGSGIHHYRRLRRLWLVRQQLRTGAAGLTIKSSALAHGFSHMGEFSRIYRAVFGEVPSRTLSESQGRMPIAYLAQRQSMIR